MTTFLFGNSNRRHIANPDDPDVTLCGLIGYRIAEGAGLKEVERLMAMPLCPTCHRTQEVQT